MSQNILTPLCFVTCCLAMLAGAAAARDFENLHPQKPGQPAAKAAPVKAAKPAPGGQDVLVKALQKLVITTPAQQKAKAEGRVTLKDLPLLDTPDFKTQMDSMIGKPVTLDLLADISKQIVAYYQAHGYPLVDAMAPGGQDITSGTVRFVVVEGHLGKLEVTGNNHFSTDSIAGSFRTKPGEPIYGQVMADDLDWVNRNPFRRVDLLYRRGAQLGQTDAVLQTADRVPYRVYGGVDNTGTQLTGNNRVLTGFNLGDVLGTGQQVNYQFTASPGLDKMQSHSADTTFALPWRHLLNASFTTQRVRPSLAAPLKSDGHALDLGLKYTVPLPAGESASHEVFAGYDFKRSNNNIEFGGTQVFNTSTNVSQFSLGYDRRQDDAWGTTNLSAVFYDSPGNMSDANSDRAFNVARANSSADYMYGVLKLERTTVLPRNFSLQTTLQGQVANQRLPGSEELTAGGSSSVRGYDESVTAGDNGLVLRNELRTPGISLMHQLGLVDTFQLLGFVDYGMVNRNNPVAGEQASSTLLSAGPGLRWNLGPYASLRLDYGWQLRHDGTGSSGNQRAHFGFTASY